MFCYLHLYMKTQLLEIIPNRGVKNGPFFQMPHLHVEEHHHQNPHISRHRRAQLEQAQSLFLQCEIDVDSGVSLTWVVG